MKTLDGFKEIVVKSTKVPGLSVSLNWDCGEGINGEYDPDDTEDEPLLRFDVIYKNGGVEDGSYCTRLRTTDPRDILTRAANEILGEAENTLYIGESGHLAHNGFKRRMEELSWLTIDNGNLV